MFDPVKRLAVAVLAFCLASAAGSAFTAIEFE
jgi:hypothetical protein